MLTNVIAATPNTNAIQAKLIMEIFEEDLVTRKVVIVLSLSRRTPAGCRGVFVVV